jgi:hypothetical protein
MIDIDAFLIDAVKRDTIPDFASSGDHFMTGGGLQFDFADNPRRLRSGHVLDFKGATLELDVDRVTDDMLRSQQAILMLGSIMGNIFGKTGEEAWGAVTTHTAVRNVRLVANYSKLAARARALGVPQFAVAGVGLQGHNAQVEKAVCVDFGAYGREAFPVWIVGADNSFDTHPLFGVDPKHEFDEGTSSSNLDYSFEGFVPEMSKDQVTVGMIMGAWCPGSFVQNPWSMGGPWRPLWRKAGSSLTFDVECPAGKWNAVQGATSYLSRGSTINGKTRWASVGVYSDYYQSQGVHVLPACSFTNCEYGVIVRLSPTAAGYEDMVDQFSAENFVIEKFECSPRNTDVFLNADLMKDMDGDIVSKNPPTRYLRNIAIDSRLTVSGNKEGLVWIPSPDTKKGGCFGKLIGRFRS